MIRATLVQGVRRIKTSRNSQLPAVSRVLLGSLGIHAAHRNLWTKTPATPVAAPESTPAAIGDGILVEEIRSEAVLPPSLSPEFPEPTVAFDVSSFPNADSALPDLSTLAPQIPPIQLGDFADLGLISNTPAGLFRYILEFTQVTTELPWFWAIIAGTIGYRLILAPALIWNAVNGTRIQPHQGRLNEIRDEIKAASARGDTPGALVLANEQRDIYKKARFSIFVALLGPVVQLPASIGMFMGISKLCSFPIEQLKNSGFEYIPDLTVSDPTYTMPIISAIMMRQLLNLQTTDADPAQSLSPHIMNIFKGVTFVSIIPLAFFPAGTVLCMTAGSLVPILQALLLRIPIVRRGLGMPPRVIYDQSGAPTFKESMEWAMNWAKGANRKIVSGAGAGKTGNPAGNVFNSAPAAKSPPSIKRKALAPKRR